jgi:hypothetical protein
MAQSSIIILGNGIRIIDLEVPRKDVADFVRSALETERENTLLRAIEVGVFCLERAGSAQDLEFVRRQVESLLDKVQDAVVGIPQETQRTLIEKIGTGDGQVLAPITSLVKEISNAMTTRVNDVRSLLAQDLDPSKETSTLGMALQKLRNLLDARRTDSVQAILTETLKNVTEERGPLATAVSAVVTAALKPLEDEIRDLAKEVRGQEAAAEALQQTIEKGDSYEDQVVEEIRAWALGLGLQVHHVGKDNQPGDVLIAPVINSTVSCSLTILVEARDRQSPVGRKAVSDILAKAMSERGATAAIYVSKQSDGLGKEIGDWAEGATNRGPFVACTHNNLFTALRFLMVQERLAQLRATLPEIDSAQLESQIQRIRTSLDRVKTINRKVSDVRGGAQDIQGEAEHLRDEVRDALAGIEEALRKAKQSALQSSTPPASPIIAQDRQQPAVS